MKKKRETKRRRRIHNQIQKVWQRRKEEDQEKFQRMMRQLPIKPVLRVPPGQGAKRKLLSLIQLLLPGAVSKRESPPSEGLPVIQWTLKELVAEFPN